MAQIADTAQRMLGGLSLDCADWELKMVPVTFGPAEATIAEHAHGFLSVAKTTPGGHPYIVL